MTGVSNDSDVFSGKLFCNCAIRCGRVTLVQPKTREFSTFHEKCQRNH